MKFVRLDNHGAVCEVIEAGSREELAELFHRDFLAALWDAHDDIDVGHVRDPVSGAFSLPAPRTRTLIDARASGIEAIDAAAETARALVGGQGSPWKASVYALKEGAVRDAVAGTLHPDKRRVLEMEAAARGLSPTDFYALVQSKADLFFSAAMSIEIAAAAGKAIIVHAETPEAADQAAAEAVATLRRISGAL